MPLLQSVYHLHCLYISRSTCFPVCFVFHTAAFYSLTQYFLLTVGFYLCVYNINAQFQLCSRQISHKVPFCYRNVHTCTFLSQLMHCRIWNLRIVGLWIWTIVIVCFSSKINVQLCNKCTMELLTKYVSRTWALLVKADTIICTLSVGV